MRFLRVEMLPEHLRSTITYRNLRANQTLYRQGDPSTAIYFVLQGRIRVETYVPDGGVVLLSLVRSGECVSEAALFADSFCSDAVAETAARVSVFPKKVLWAMLDHDPALAHEYMNLQFQRFCSVRCLMVVRGIRSARERVLHYLKMHKPLDTDRICVDRPLKRLANDLGLTHETFYRAVKELETDGVLRRDGKTIVFTKPKTKAMAY